MLKQFRLSCIVALLLYHPAATAAAYPYTDTQQARVYTVDVSEIQAFTAAVNIDYAMWRMSTAVSFTPWSRAIALDLSAPGGMLVVGANANWTTDTYFVNTSTSTVTQKVGHLTFIKPGFDPIVLEPTITLGPGAFTILKRIDKNFDWDWHQYGPDSAPGLYGLAVDPRLQTSVHLEFGGGAAKFNCPSLSKFLQAAAGPPLTFTMLRTDTDPHVGSYPTILNTNTGAVTFELRVCGPDGACASEPHQAPPGVSQFGVGKLCATGCSAQFCLLSCSAGGGGSLASGIYPFVVIGDGGTQDVRLPN